MWRKLDLNEPAGKILAASGILLIAVPLILSAALALWQTEGYADVLQTVMTLSIGIGVLVACVFGGLIIAEQIQDQRYDESYRKQKDRKIESADGQNECQYCGNRQVSVSDRFCHVCGKNLH